MTGVASALPPVLHVVTCGSVDDGKSTLIGRLLYQQDLVFDDHMIALERDSRKHGTTGEEIDVALLLDGLQAEREQGITIDVAYRTFRTGRRVFVVADAPGHEQYLRNMATGASTADVAVLLADARKGLVTQTRRHAIVAHLMGVRAIVLAVNKFDLVGYDQDSFERIANEFADFAKAIGIADTTAIPLSARYGENVSSRSREMPWYDGPSLLEYLEAVDPRDLRDDGPLRMPVQMILRPEPQSRRIAGTIASGRLSVDDDVLVLPSGRSSKVATIRSAGGPAKTASAGDAVTVTLATEVDVMRGDMLASTRPHVADQFAAHIIWMSDAPLMPGRDYLMKVNFSLVHATVTRLEHRVDVDTLSKLAAETLSFNEIGVCNLSVSRDIVFDTYGDNRDTGSFILIDRYSNETVAAGMIDFPLQRAANVRHQEFAVTKANRVDLTRHRAAVLWFTGLPSSGKSTIANLVELALHARGIHTISLDGDNVRQGLSRDLGFTAADRVENIRRVGEVAKLMTDAGLIVLCSFISPFRAERLLVRELLAPDEFIEIFVDAPLETCIARDPKGLYRGALAGTIKNFTGVDQAYEPPDDPELHLDAVQNPARLAQQVMDEVIRRKLI